TGSAADSGSGVDHVDFQRAPTNGGPWTTIGTATSAPYSTSFDTTTVADGHYDFRTVAVDVAGNQATSSTVADRLVDNTPPTASAPISDTIDNAKPATTDDAPSGWQATAVTVNLTATDAGSGVNVTEYSVDGGSYVVGTSVTIPAPADGSNDGAHTIAYFSAD